MWDSGMEREVAAVRVGVGHALATEVTSSLETSSFDLIIWEGQSDFVDEESL